MPCAFAAEDLAAVATRDQRPQPQLPVALDRVRRERRAAITGERPPERSLGGSGQRRGSIRQRRERSKNVTSIRAAFERQRSLPDRGEAFGRVEEARDAVCEPEALETGRRENDRGVVALIETMQARIDVAAQRLDDQRWISFAQLRLAPQARSSD